jgi:hypothetical protein
MWWGARLYCRSSIVETKISAQELGIKSCRPLPSMLFTCLCKVITIRVILLFAPSGSCSYFARVRRQIIVPIIDAAVVIELSTPLSWNGETTSGWRAMREREEHPCDSSTNWTRFLSQIKAEDQVRAKKVVGTAIATEPRAGGCILHLPVLAVCQGNSVVICTCTLVNNFRLRPGPSILLYYSAKQ